MRSITYDQTVWCAYYDWHMSRVMTLSEGVAPPPLLGVELSMAAAKGWLKIGPYEWLCPECAARYLKEMNDSISSSQESS